MSEQLYLNYFPRVRADEIAMQSEIPVSTLDNLYAELKELAAMHPVRLVYDVEDTRSLSEEITYYVGGKKIWELANEVVVQDLSKATVRVLKSRGQSSAPRRLFTDYKHMAITE